MYYAHTHSANDRAHWEPLRVHLERVGERAAAYAAIFDAETEARFAGLLHDLGKYSDLFTRRLEGRVKGLDHWSPGAWAALTQARNHGIATALAVQGHHLGLQEANEKSLRDLDPRYLADRHPLVPRLTETDPKALLDRLRADGLRLPDLKRSLFEATAPKLSGMLDVRMLFSTLVDADYVETEAHFQGRAPGERSYRPCGPDLQAARALEVLRAHLADLKARSDADPAVLALRSDLLAACLERAAQEPGLFTLTAPTGTGKTFSMLAFALEHARRHGLRRVVMAIPYLTIIEQTAQEYRRALEKELGEEYVLEHHSLAGTGPESADGHGEGTRQLARLLAENWDAPLVVTTNVQLLQSLFSNRPSACRKLHRLARSVILFDEVQTLPPKLAVPTLAALSRLAERYGATVVFSTATQPAFEHLDDKVRAMAISGWRPQEIVAPELGLFARARRTRVHWEVDEAVSWPELADRILASEQVLCIVNLKRHARDLALALRDRGAEGLFHLSTNLCPGHRQEVLAKVRRRLEDREPCRLISTQCVEAGVDVDFPVVFRAFGPLEAIAQAAGRCNRRGRMPELGEVRLFLPEDEGYPPGCYQQAADVTRMLLRELGTGGVDFDFPELFRRYYEDFYDLTKTPAGAKELTEAIKVRDFAEVAQQYRLIEQDTINVVVPWDREAFARLREDQGRLTRDWIRRARPHAVSLFRPKPKTDVWNVFDPVRAGKKEKSDDWYLLTAAGSYHRELLGLITGEDPDLWIA